MHVTGHYDRSHIQIWPVIDRYFVPWYIYNKIVLDFLIKIK
jgi:hypothetical protein